MTTLTRNFLVQVKGSLENVYSLPHMMNEIPTGWKLPDAKPTKPRESASIMVTHGDLSDNCKVMLCHRVKELPAFPNYWAFPGGGISRIDKEATNLLEGFTETDAAYIGILRELIEEVGLTPLGQKLVLVENEYRKEIVEKKDAWINLVLEEKIPCDIDRITKLSERTTPPFAALRFSNKFLHFHTIGEIPNVELVSGTEFDKVRWESPQILIQEWKENKIKIPPPIVTILLELCELLTEHEYTIDAIKEGQRIEQESSLEKEILFAHGVECLPLKTSTLPPAVSTNCYILGFPKGQIVIIDPAAKEPQELMKLEKRINQLISDGCEIVATIFTHYHSDHIGDLDALSNIYSAPIWTSAETNSILPELKSQRILSEGDKIVLNSIEGELILEVMITPGHSPGHICLNTNAGIISGDMVAGIGTILVPPNDGNMEEYLIQLKRLKSLKPKLLFPSHGPVLPLPEKVLNHYIEHRSSRQNKIMDAVNTGISDLEKISEVAYEDTPNAHKALTHQQTLSHLLSLQRQGLISKNGVNWTAN